MANDVAGPAPLRAANISRQHNAQARLMVLANRLLEMIFFAYALLHDGSYDTSFCTATHSLKD
jgi:hypothetical protein